MIHSTIDYELANGVHTGLLSCGEQPGGCGPCCGPQAALDDDFMMNRFKVERCMSNSGHIWRNCPFVHPGEPVQRRHPSLHLPELCPKVKQGHMCPDGPEKCCYAHNPFEAWLHPERFKTILCRKGSKCPRGVCFFAHSESELRRPTKAKPLPPAAAAAQQQYPNGSTVELSSNIFTGTAADLPGQQMMSLSMVSLGVPSSLPRVSLGLPHASLPVAAVRSGINKSGREIRANSNSSSLFSMVSATGSDASSGGSSSGLSSPLTIPSAAAAAGSQVLGSQQLLQDSSSFGIAINPISSSSSGLLAEQVPAAVVGQASLMDLYQLWGDGSPNGLRATATAAALHPQQLQQLPAGWGMLSPSTAAAAAGTAGYVSNSQPPMQLLQPPMLHNIFDVAAAGGLQHDQLLLQQLQALSLQQQQQQQQQ